MWLRSTIGREHSSGWKFRPQPMPVQPTCAAPLPFVAATRPLIRAEPEIRNTVEVFEPLKPEIERLTRGIKSAFDPSGLLNRGRMYANF